MRWLIVLVMGVQTLVAAGEPERLEDGERAEYLLLLAGAYRAELMELEAKVALEQKARQRAAAVESLREWVEERGREGCSPNVKTGEWVCPPAAGGEGSKAPTDRGRAK